MGLALTLIALYPEGREHQVYAISTALLVCAAGAFGYKRVWGKADSLAEVGAEGSQPLKM